MNKFFRTLSDNAKNNGNIDCMDNGNQNKNKPKSIPSK